jgi:hypothetical protein
MTKICCPACSSENVQKLSLVHSGGLTNVDLKTTANTVGIGVGIGTGGLGAGLGVGSSTGKTTGTQQTELSKLAAPPQPEFLISKKAIWISGGVAAIAAIPTLKKIDVMSGISIVFGGGISLVVAGFVWAIVFYLLNSMMVPKEEKQAALERHEAATREWDQKFLCLTCGKDFKSGGRS